MRSKTRRMRVLLDASVEPSALGAVTRELIDQGLAIRAGADRRVTLSARGIWTAEQAKGILTVDGLLSYIDDKWLSCFDESSVPLSDKERLVLFALLAARGFSPEAGVNTNRRETFEAWIELLLSASAFLQGRGVIGDIGLKQALSSSGAAAGLPPLGKFFRYTENLPPKTDGIYVAKGNVYSLDVATARGVERAKLVFLFRLVFGDDADLGMVGEIHEFCRDRAYDIAVKVLPPGGPSYASQDIDRLMDGAIRECMLGA